MNALRLPSGALTGARVLARTSLSSRVRRRRSRNA